MVGGKVSGWLPLSLCLLRNLMHSLLEMDYALSPSHQLNYP